MLRDVAPTDAAPLARLGRESFCAAFADIYREEDLSRFLEETYSERVIAAEIADPDVVHRVIANDNNILLAFIKLRLTSPYAAMSDAVRPLALAQLYTDAAHTGQGLGAQLMDWCLAYAQREGRGAVQLSVYAENPGAQRFYRRYGFEKIADIDFWVGDHRDDEYLFERRLP